VQKFFQRLASGDVYKPCLLLGCLIKTSRCAQKHGKGCLTLCSQPSYTRAFRWEYAPGGSFAAALFMNFAIFFPVVRRPWRLGREPHGSFATRADSGSGLGWRRPPGRSFAPSKSNTRGPAPSARRSFWPTCARALASPTQNRRSRKDIRNLYKTGNISNVRIFGENVPDGVKVIVVVQSKAKITEVHLNGVTRSRKAASARR